MNRNSGIRLLPFAALLLSALAGWGQAGSVYTLTNATTSNEVLIFNRTAGGQIAAAGSVPTGGIGSGGGLGNQGASAMDADNRFLFAVNAGSDDISVFRIQRDGLRLVERVASGGSRPISLAVSRNFLYVLNNGAAAGSSDTVAGFHVSESGRLSPIVNGLVLSAASVGPAQIGFNNDGDVLVVSEKNTNNLDVFTVDEHGVASGPFVIPSAGQTPFGFAFGKRKQLFISDAFGGAAGAGAVSSYIVFGKGSLRTVSNSVPDAQSAPCWVVLTSDGRFAYTTNTGSGTVSGYSVEFGGRLRLLTSGGQTAFTGDGSKPLDASISNDGRYLYVLAPGTGNIQGFFLGIAGSLSPLTHSTGVPASASGLIAR